jgi:putative tryptophan/tyrosine transport system substrate-binding protein
VGAAVVFGRRTVLAQEPGRTYRIGVLSNFTREAPIWAALLDELGKSGFVESKNLTVDPRGFEFRVDHASGLVEDLVQSQVDAILFAGKPMSTLVQAATRTIPILSVTDDMLVEGLVPSLAQPGGNLTGISILSSELNGKRQEILIDLLPGARHIAALVDPGTVVLLQLETLRKAAATRGVELSAYPAANPEEIASAIDSLSASGATALNVLASPLLSRYRRLLVERSAARRLPAIYQRPETAGEGGLIAYGPRFTQIYRQLARQLVKLLRGAQPADIPVEQPTQFELVININIAKALGITVPKSLLALADEVIE